MCVCAAAPRVSLQRCPRVPHAALDFAFDCAIYVVCARRRCRGRGRMLLLPSSTAFEVSGSRIALWPRVAVRREARPADICVQRVATDVNDVSRRRKEACGVCARLALGLLFNFSRPSYYILCVFVSRVSVCICVCVWGAGVSIYHRAGYLLLPYTFRGTQARGV